MPEALPRKTERTSADADTLPGGAPSSKAPGSEGKISSRTIGYSETLIDLCHQAQDDNSSIKNFTESAKYLSSSIIGYFSS